MTEKRSIRVQQLAAHAYREIRHFGAIASIMTDIGRSSAINNVNHDLESQLAVQVPSGSFPTSYVNYY